MRSGPWTLHYVAFPVAKESASAKIKKLHSKPMQGMLEPRASPGIWVLGPAGKVTSRKTVPPPLHPKNKAHKYIMRIIIDTPVNIRFAYF